MTSKKSKRCLFSTHLWQRSVTAKAVHLVMSVMLFCSKTLAEYLSTVEHFVRSPEVKVGNVSTATCTYSSVHRACHACNVCLMGFRTGLDVNKI